MGECACPGHDLLLQGVLVWGWVSERVQACMCPAWCQACLCMQRALVVLDARQIS